MADLKSGAASGRVHVVNAQAMASRRYKTPSGIAIPDGVCWSILLPQVRFLALGPK